MTTDLTVVEGDYGYTLNFTVTNNGAAYNISGGTVLFKYKKKVTGTTTSRTCTIDNGPNGLCSYVVQNTDFTDAGSYDWELEATVGSKVLTHKGNDLIVVKEL